MPNPYAPRSRAVRRTAFPAGRLRSVGLDAGDVAYWRDVVGGLDHQDREELLAGWAAMDDDQLAQDTTRALTGVPAPEPAPAPHSGAQGAPVDDPLVVPEGSVDAVMAWVMERDGSYRTDRAQAALDHEMDKPQEQQRSTLLRPLRELTRA